MLSHGASVGAGARAATSGATKCRHKCTTLRVTRRKRQAVPWRRPWWWWRRHNVAVGTATTISRWQCHVGSAMTTHLFVERLLAADLKNGSTRGHDIRSYSMCHSMSHSMNRSMDRLGHESDRVQQSASNEHAFSRPCRTARALAGRVHVGCRRAGGAVGARGDKVAELGAGRKRCRSCCTTSLNFG